MRIVSPEHGMIDRRWLPPGVLARLRRIDQQQSTVSGRPVFDWSRGDCLRVRNYVGIIQVPGLVVEILPKVGGPGECLVDPDATDHEGKGWARAQKNLVYMLMVAGHLPFEERQLAAQQTSKLPLFEALIWAFARRLFEELRRGPDRAYVRREENLPVVRGKILTSIDVKLNVVRRDRVFVAYDDFVSDTPMNRVLKATSRRLLLLTTLPGTQQRLQECVAHLSDVEDVEVTPESFGPIHYTRNSERFAPLVDFCRMVLRGMTPTPGAGGTETFSLLFPMETLFQEFIGRTIRRHAHEVGLVPEQVRLQARGKTRWLVRDEEGNRRFRLKPDLLILGLGGGVQTVLDTKWKRLKSLVDDAKHGVAQSDMYQLFAYAHQFRSPENVMLYPAAGEPVHKRYQIAGLSEPRSIRIDTVDVERDLAATRPLLIAELYRAIWGENKANSISCHR